MRHKGIVKHGARNGTILLLSLFALAAGAQSANIRAGATDDAAWTRTYATDCCSAMKHPCAPSTDGYENEFNGDARLPGLLKRSLPQRESWWVDGYGGSAPVSSIVQQFIGVPGKLIVDQNRYVTASGCVPHDCLTNGLLWIDTGSHPATVIFVAEVMINSVKGQDKNHLWLYASTPLNFEDLPPDLLENIRLWHDDIATKNSPQAVTVATIVQPNGRMQDLTYDTLFYKQNEPQYPKPGAKQ